MVGILLLVSFFHAAESQNLDLLRQIMYLTSAGFFAHEQLFFYNTCWFSLLLTYHLDHDLEWFISAET